MQLADAFVCTTAYFSLVTLFLEKGVVTRLHVSTLLIVESLEMLVIIHTCVLPE